MEHALFIKEFFPRLPLAKGVSKASLETHGDLEQALKVEILELPPLAVCLKGKIQRVSCWLPCLGSKSAPCQSLCLGFVFSSGFPPISRMKTQGILLLCRGLEGKQVEDAQDRGLVSPRHAISICTVLWGPLTRQCGPREFTQMKNEQLDSVFKDVILSLPGWISILYFSYFPRTLGILIGSFFQIPMSQNDVIFLKFWQFSKCWSQGL